MKKFLASTLIAVTAFTMVAEAFARPVGGGRSIGRECLEKQARMRWTRRKRLSIRRLEATRLDEYGKPFPDRGRHS